MAKCAWVEEEEEQEEEDVSEVIARNIECVMQIKPRLVLCFSFLSTKLDLLAIITNVSRFPGS